MNLPALRSEPDFRRHQLVRVAGTAWHDVLATREDWRELPLIGDWVARGRPFIVRRPLPGETHGVPLGLPLPYWAGKRRISFVVPTSAIVASTGLPLLMDAIDTAPVHWRNSLRDIQSLALTFGMQVRVFGSLGWQMLTGLEYLHEASDADLIMTLPRQRHLEAFLSSMANIASRAPMRIDGEFLLDDGAGVNWRELHDHVPELALKTHAGVALVSRAAIVRSLA